MSSDWKGKFIIVIGPSGSGKSTLIANVKKTFPNFYYPITSTTRKMRPGEKDGSPYNFLTREEFEKKIKENAFIEWAEYSGNLYGTPKSGIMEAIKEGKFSLKEVEVQGARILKKIFSPSNLSVIYIDAGPWDLLKERIIKRTHIEEYELENRRKRYEDERTFIPEADYVVSNYDGGLEKANKDMTETIKKIIEHN